MATLKLVGDAEASVEGDGLRVAILSSGSKIGAPAVTVTVLVTNAEGDGAQVRWLIENGNLDGAWVDVAGGRFDVETNAYIQEELPGWQIRLDSIDDQASSGAPRAVTVSLREVE